jgi:tripartite-type tricarboxylate transporter receptor subunit TctC
MRPFVCRIAGLVLLASVAPALAQTYPNRPITIVVGYPPRASSDLLARTVGEPLAAVLGQPALIDNRAGAGGNVAAAYVARAPGDGYTLMVGTDAMMTSNIYLYKNAAFDPAKDFAPITNAGANIICLAVNNELPGADCLCARQPGQAQLRIVGYGFAASPLGRAAAANGEHRHSTCALQGWRRRRQ